MTDSYTTPGTVLLGKYRVEKVLGKGAMGVVVAAVHLGFETRIAIKFMLPGRGPDPERDARFMREARIAARLTSQHVGKVLDVGMLDDGETRYLVMEYLDGQDLDAVLRARGRLPFVEAVNYVLQVCEAVAEAHKAGIIHRDLKPANLFLARSADGAPCVKVLDFGVSKLTEAGADFTEAKKLVAAGRFNDACPKFEESQRLDPTPGTLLNLGDCYKQASPPRTASAWGAYQQAGILARNRGDEARQEAASQRARAIEPVLSKVTISPTPAARIPGLDVKWDGKNVGVGSWDIAIPVDSGEHTVEAAAPGKTSWTGKVLVRQNGGTMTVEVPALALAPAETAAIGDSPAKPYWGTQRILGLSVGAAGLVGVVIGSIYGVKTGNTNAEALRHCRPGGSNLCDAQGVALGEKAFGSATVSTASFIAGGAAVAGGAILFFTAPSSVTHADGALVPRRLEARPLVGWGFGGVTVRGEW